MQGLATTSVVYDITSQCILCTIINERLLILSCICNMTNAFPCNVTCYTAQVMSDHITYACYISCKRMTQNLFYLFLHRVSGYTNYTCILRKINIHVIQFFFSLKNSVVSVMDKLYSNFRISTFME